MFTPKGEPPEVDLETLGVEGENLTGIASFPAENGDFEDLTKQVIDGAQDVRSVEAGKKDIQYWTVGLKGVDLKHRGGWGFGQSGDYWVDLNLLEPGSIEQVNVWQPCFPWNSRELKVDASPVIEGGVFVRGRCMSAVRIVMKLVRAVVPESRAFCES